jgi:hypothetical protein
MPLSFVINSLLKDAIHVMVSLVLDLAMSTYIDPPVPSWWHKCLFTCIVRHIIIFLDVFSSANEKVGIVFATIMSA